MSFSLFANRLTGQTESWIRTDLQVRPRVGSGQTYRSDRQLDQDRLTGQTESWIRTDLQVRQRVGSGQTYRSDRVSMRKADSSFSFRFHVSYSYVGTPGTLKANVDKANVLRGHVTGNYNQQHKPKVSSHG